MHSFQFQVTAGAAKQWGLENLKNIWAVKTEEKKNHYVNG